MIKNIKFIVPFIIIILSITIGSVVYAKESRREQAPMFANENGIKNEIRGEVKVKIENNKTDLNKTIADIKIKREEFKLKIETIKEETKAEITTMKNNFKVSLDKIKNQTKRTSTEKIVNTIQELNTKWTNNLSDKITQIENVLISVKSRIAKAEDKGLDVSSLAEKVTRAENAISIARESILAQTKKVYEVTVTDETTLKTQMKDLRDTFSKDIKAVGGIVKSAHVALRDTATALAQIPKIDEASNDVDKASDNNDDKKTSDEVEDNDTNNN